MLKRLTVVVLASLVALSLTACGAKEKTVKGDGVSASFGLFKSEQFTPTDVCVTCHVEIHDQWSGSMHNNSFKDPVFQKIYQFAVEDTDGDRVVEDFCIVCHSPVGFMSGEIPPPDGSKLSEIGKNGIQCDFCHTVSAARGIGNFAVKSSPGNTKRAQFKDAVSPYHETEYSELHTSAEFCGMCHNVNHPVNDLPLEKTYTEWKEGPYAKEGIQCQDCHMTPGPGVTKPNPGKAAIMGPDRPHLYTHSIVGGNVAVPTLLGSIEHAQLAEERLKSAAAVEILPLTKFKPGAENTLQVKVTNKGAGHYLPTGLTETRQMWLQIKVTDGSGKVLFASGGLNKDGSIEKNSIVYNTVAADETGKATHKVWRAEKILSDYRIPPRQSVTETYKASIPVGAKGPFTVSAILRYRSAPQELIRELFGEEEVKLPITDMAGDSAVTK